MTSRSPARPRRPARSLLVLDDGSQRPALLVDERGSPGDLLLDGETVPGIATFLFRGLPGVDGCAGYHFAPPLGCGDATCSCQQYFPSDEVTHRFTGYTGLYGLSTFHPRLNNGWSPSIRAIRVTRVRRRVRVQPEYGEQRDHARDPQKDHDERVPIRQRLRHSPLRADFSCGELEVGEAQMKEGAAD